jgi:hypothetical protein
VPYIPEINKKENKSFMINGVLVEKGDRTINIKHSKMKHLLYSEEQSEVFANQYCGALMRLEVQKKIIHEYDLFGDGYVVSRIEVQNTVFLERDGNVYNCPEASSHKHFLLNGPNQIFGL